MSTVDFTYNNGRQRVMAERYAKVLNRLGHGTYLTRDMQAQPVSTIGISTREETRPDTEMDKSKPRARKPKT